MLEARSFNFAKLLSYVQKERILNLENALFEFI